MQDSENEGTEETDHASSDSNKVEGLCQIGGKCKRRAVTRGLYMNDGQEYLLCYHHYEALKPNTLWQIIPPPDKTVEGTLDQQAIDQKLAKLEETTERKCIVCVHWYDNKGCLPCYKLETEHPNFQRVEGMSLIRRNFRAEHHFGTQ